MKLQKTIKTVGVVVALIMTLAVWDEAHAGKSGINRYEVDFWYQAVGYQILSETDHTVALCQSFDIDIAPAPNGMQKIEPLRFGIGPEGFVMAKGLMGPMVVIPETVYDEEGTPYTVTALADYAINYLTAQLTLVLPPTLEHLNGGIDYSLSLIELILPDGLKEIDGITNCPRLKSVKIPYGVEKITERSMSNCGFVRLYLPPALRVLEDNVLSGCENLDLVKMSGVETMGKDCFRNCVSYTWANLPESLRTMGEGCFNDCPSLELVSLPWSEIKMEDCFNGCHAINRIEVLAIDPNTFPEGCFLDVDRSTCVLGVPVGSEEKYRQAEGWKDFLNIVGDVPAIESTATASIPNMDFRVWGGKGILSIISPIDTQIDVFTLSGEKTATVSKEGISCLHLPAGVYIVSSPFGCRKVAVG